MFPLSSPPPSKKGEERREISGIVANNGDYERPRIVLQRMLHGRENIGHLISDRSFYSIFTFGDI